MNNTTEIFCAVNAYKSMTTASTFMLLTMIDDEKLDQQER